MSIIRPNQEKHCGYCYCLEYESTDGYGYCDKIDETVHCSDKACEYFEE